MGYRLRKNDPQRGSLADVDQEISNFRRFLRSIDDTHPFKEAAQNVLNELEEEHNKNNSGMRSLSHNVSPTHTRNLMLALESTRELINSNNEDVNTRVEKFVNNVNTIKRRGIGRAILGALQFLAGVAILTTTFVLFLPVLPFSFAGAVGSALLMHFGVRNIASGVNTYKFSKQLGIVAQSVKQKAESLQSPEYGDDNVNSNNAEQTRLLSAKK